MHMGNMMRQFNAPPESKGDKEEVIKIFEDHRAKHQLNSTLFNHKAVIEAVEALLYQPYNPKTKKQAVDKIKELASFWLQFQLPHLYQNEDVIAKELLEYYSSWILSARVLKKVGLFFQELMRGRLEENEHSLGRIRKYISDNQLRFVFGRQLFEKKMAKFSNYSYHSTNYTNQYVNKAEQTNYVQSLYNQCVKYNCEILVKVFELLATLDIIVLEGKQPLIKNDFMNKLQNIKRQDQRDMFVENYSFIHLQQIKKQLAQKQLEQVQKKMKKLLPNYMFYKNRKTIRGIMNLQKLHDRYEDYQFLEHTHDYVQWMFPNHYGSSFNSNSDPLNYIQSQLFIQDKQIALSMFFSIVLFFDFMGIRFDNNLQLVIEQERRLKDVILKCYHNHLRLMRILACLSVTGFRSIALKFIQFLDRNSSSGGIIQKERSEFLKSWEIYGDKYLARAKEMCFLQRQEFPESHEFWKQIAIQLPFDESKRSWISTEYFIQSDNGWNSKKAKKEVPKAVAKKDNAKKEMVSQDQKEEEEVHKQVIVQGKTQPVQTAVSKEQKIEIQTTKKAAAAEYPEPVKSTGQGLSLVQQHKQKVEVVKEQGQVVVPQEK